MWGEAAIWLLRYAGVLATPEAPTATPSPMPRPSPAGGALPSTRELIAPVASSGPEIRNAPGPSSVLPPDNRVSMDDGIVRNQKITGTVAGSVAFGVLGVQGADKRTLDAALDLGPAVDVAVATAAGMRALPGQAPRAEYEEVAGVGRAKPTVQAEQFEKRVAQAQAEGRGEVIPSDTKPKPYLPPDYGALPGTTRREVLAPNTLLDRFGGSALSDFFAPAGTPIEQRSLPHGTAAQSLRTFRVERALPVTASETAPAFDQTGGGTQYRTDIPLPELLRQGYLSEVF